MQKIHKFFEAGKIYKLGASAISLQVFSLQGLSKIINHIDKFPLITQKQADFELFRQAYEIFKCRKHLTRDGLRKILSIKATMNLSLSEKLKTAFPDIENIQRRLVKEL